jgi:hypothetical protein
LRASTSTYSEYVVLCITDKNNYVPGLPPFQYNKLRIQLLVASQFVSRSKFGPMVLTGHSKRERVTIVATGG